MKMSYNIKHFFKILSLASVCSIMAISCEPDADDLGEQFFVDNALEGTKEHYDIVAYNKNNEDFIQADTRTLNVVKLGAFKEAVFGMQKASYVSQLNLVNYDPDFGNNVVLDSAVMHLVSSYDSESVTEASMDFDYPDGNGGIIESTQNLTMYPVVKYGNDKINDIETVFNINVHEVTDFLKSANDTVYSNANVNYSNLIGTKEFKGYVSKVKYTKKEDDSVLFEASEGLRIPLDTNFFQTKIIDQQGTDNLKDVASFIRYFRGVRISVAEDDGYLFNIDPNSASIVLYYTYENDEGEQQKSKFVINMGAGNAHIGQYEYDRSSTDTGDALGNINNVDGDKKLFAQGMGGPSIMFKIPSSVIENLRDKFNEDKIGIMGAKIRIYTDETIWDNSYTKPKNFVFLKDKATDFMPEIFYQTAIPNFKLISNYDLDKPTTYYDLSVTKTLKEAIENSTESNDVVLKLDIGEFQTNNTGAVIGYNKTTRAFAPERLVFIGSDPGNDKRVQLEVTYAK